MQINPKRLLFNQLGDEYPNLKPYLKRIRQYLGQTFFSFQKHDIPTCFDIDNKNNLDFILSTTPPEYSFVHTMRQSGAYFGKLKVAYTPCIVNCEKEKEEAEMKDVIHVHLNLFTQMHDSMPLKYRKFGIIQRDIVRCNIVSQLLLKFKLRQRRIESKFFEEKLFGRLQLELLNATIDGAQVLELVDQNPNLEYHNLDDASKLRIIVKE